MELATLRPYQKAAVTAAVVTDNGILVLPTGAGKSLCIAGIVQAMAGKTIIFQPNKEILEQNYNKIVSFGFTEAKIYSASMGVKEIGKATFATIGSVMNNLELFEDVETVIIDECHLVNAKAGQYLDFIAKVKPRKLIGLTATPYRLHTNSMGSQIKMLTRTRPRVFKEIVHVTQTYELVEQNFLVNPTFEAVEVGDEHRGTLKPNSTGANFSDSSVKQFLKEINVVDQMETCTEKALLNNSKHILVFAQSIAESELFVQRCLRRGWSAASVSGETPKQEREQLLADFKSGEIQIIVNVGVLTTGFDFPELDCLVIGRPTMSLALWYQMVGRVVRPHASKEVARVYDICGNHTFFGNPLDLKLGKTGNLWDIFNRYGRVTTTTLDSAKPADDTIHFGKHKGKRLKDVPVDYMQWFVDNASGPMKAIFSAEIERRNLFKE